MAAEGSTRIKSSYFLQTTSWHPGTAASSGSAAPAAQDSQRRLGGTAEAHRARVGLQGACLQAVCTAQYNLHGAEHPWMRACICAEHKLGAGTIDRGALARLGKVKLSARKFNQARLTGELPPAPAIVQELILALTCCSVDCLDGMVVTARH